MELFVTMNRTGMDSFLIENRTRRMQPFFHKELQERNETGRQFLYSEQNGKGWKFTEWNESGMIKQRKENRTI